MGGRSLARVSPVPRVRRVGSDDHNALPAAPAARPRPEAARPGPRGDGGQGDTPVLLASEVVDVLEGDVVAPGRPPPRVGLVIRSRSGTERDDSRLRSCRGFCLLFLTFVQRS